MSQHKLTRRRERQSEALTRQAAYDTYVDDLILNSSPDVAQKFFLSLSPTQQRRIFDDSRFARLSWLVRLEEVMS